MAASIASVLEYLGKMDPEAAAIARERFWLPLTVAARAINLRARGSHRRYRKCEEAVVAQPRDLFQQQLKDGIAFSTQRRTRVIASAERYCRIMYNSVAESWNLHDGHMFETLRNVLAARGPSAKAIVWAQNSHIGECPTHRNGCHPQRTDTLALIGTGTHTGTVAAVSDCAGEFEVKQVNAQFHDAGIPRFLVDMSRDGDATRAPGRQRLERIIGVIYRPANELMSHYADASLSQQFDAFLWFDETSAVTPLEPQHARLAFRIPNPVGL